MSAAEAWPAPPPAKTVRGALARQRLVDAAATVFAEYGYAGARITDMVQLAGMSHGNFYRHFQGKDEALLAVFETPMAELRSALGEQPAGRLDHAALVKSVTAYLRVYARHRRLVRVVREAAASTPDFARLWMRLRHQLSDRTEQWLGSLAAAGLVEPDANLPLLAETLGSVLEHLSYTQIAIAPGLPRPAVIAEVGRAVADAWYLILCDRSRLKPG